MTLVRLIQAMIVVFWLVMTGLLIQAVWFPDDSRLTRVPPEIVLSRFLGRRVGSELVILERNEEIGTLTVSTGGLDPADAERLGARYEIVLAGTLQFTLATAGDDEDGLVPVGYAGRLRIDEQSRPVSTLIDLRFPESGASVMVESGTAPGSLKFTAARHGEVILDSASGDAGGVMAQARLLLGAWGFQGAGERGGVGGAGAETMPSLLEEPECRQGTVEIAGRRFSAYLLDFPLPGGAGRLRLVFTRAGELVQVVPPVVRYEIISDIFCTPPDPTGQRKRRKLDSPEP